MKKVKKILSLALGLSLAVSCTLSTITSSAINISDDPFDMDSQAGAICFLSSKSVTITLDKTEYAYNGTQIKPEVVSVHYKASTYDLDLALGDDYTVEYGENVELGKGTVT
ncbi:MAG: hypothetical protein Q4D35_02495, partial [Ruminococcus sp.]|nr:hypothetical protein [Ruminococcus sp.]